jgi:hypothetical protein
MTAASRGDVVVDPTDSVRWFALPGDDPRPRRGFCPACGSSLFWDAPERPTLGIAAGTLDPPTGLRTAGHIFVSHASDYELTADGLPYSAGPTPTDWVLLSR